MKVLHLCVAGIVDKFYLTFLGKLRKQNIDETIFIPYSLKDYSKSDLEVLNKYKSESISTIALPIKTRIDRILYQKKIHKYFKKLDNEVNLKNYTIMHAHHLFSDGGVAYLANKKYGIPYITAIRTTDINAFIKNFPHLKFFARKIIDNAKKIVFITPDLKEATINKIYCGHKENFPEWKSLVIPNGINDFWIDNKAKCGKKLENSNNISLIQISKLNNRKRVDISIKAVAILKERGIKTNLIILGDGDKKEDLKLLIEKLNLKEEVNLVGFVGDLETIKNYCNKSDIFVMVSSSETFGLVYIEAMSQGLPIIGVDGTGVSGYFKNQNVGVFIKKPDEIMVADAVEKILSDYSIMSENTLKRIEDFKWDSICEKYMKIYSETSL